MAKITKIQVDNLFGKVTLSHCKNKKEDEKPSYAKEKKLSYGLMGKKFFPVSKNFHIFDYCKINSEKIKDSKALLKYLKNPHDVDELLKYINPTNRDFIFKKLLAMFDGVKFDKKQMAFTIEHCYNTSEAEQKKIIEAKEAIFDELMLQNNKYQNWYINALLREITPYNKDFAAALLKDGYDDLCNIVMIARLISTKSSNDDSEIFKSRKEVYDIVKDKIPYLSKNNREDFPNLLASIEPQNKDFAIQLIKDEILSFNSIEKCIKTFSYAFLDDKKETIDARQNVYNRLKKEYTNDLDKLMPYFPLICTAVNPINMDFIFELIKNKDFNLSEIAKIADTSYCMTKDSAKEAINSRKEIYKTLKKEGYDFSDIETKTYLYQILAETYFENQDFANELLTSKKASLKNILSCIQTKYGNLSARKTAIDARKELYDAYSGYTDKNDELVNLLSFVKQENKELANILIKSRKFSASQISALLKEEKISKSHLKLFLKKLKKSEIKTIKDADLAVAIQLVSLFNIDDVNKIPKPDLNDAITNVVSMNADSFKINSRLKHLFPLAPTTKEEYCCLVPNLVQALSSKQNCFNKQETERFKVSMSVLAWSLEIMSDWEFNKLEFSLKDDKICCPQNKNIEHSLNKILAYIPEIKEMVAKKQHRGHSFDLFKHSLKVMQKISQSEEYKNLSESDKDILLLASLLHDFCKKENEIDDNHSKKSANEAYFIASRFNFEREQEIKLYTLIKNHHWLKDASMTGFFGNANDKKLRDKAYDLRYDNLFDLSLIFSMADLKAVKDSDAFYIRNKNIYTDSANKIKKYIKELKTTQPLLPVSKLPSAKRIKKEIKTIYSDGSTNIKGIYIAQNGAVIIKFNEVENSTWAKIGFERGSVSKGIKIKTRLGTECTGNIKFFVHGLDFPNQLAKFDAFALPDSEVLLSVSYTERPESRYNFFRPQGVILNCDTKYIHGGGKKDTGSGFGKNIQGFKDRYINGSRSSERDYISALIKEKFHINDADYLRFVETYKNTSLANMPSEVQNKLIETYSTLTDSSKSNRPYNEIYISNPEVAGVFAAFDLCSQNPVEFLQDNEYFLLSYAEEKNIPFILFGN